MENKQQMEILQKDQLDFRVFNRLTIVYKTTNVRNEEGML